MRGAALPERVRKAGRKLIIPLAEDDDVVAVVATVTRLLPPFELACLETDDDWSYVITPATPGVPMAELREGQRLLCYVSTKLPRVVLSQRLDSC